MRWTAIVATALAVFGLSLPAAAGARNAAAADPYELGPPPAPRALAARIRQAAWSAPAPRSSVAPQSSPAPHTPLAPQVPGRASAPLPQPPPTGPPRSYSDALGRLLAAGEILPATAQADLAAMVAARRSLGKLHGTRRTELAAVIANLTRIATAGMLTPSRLPGLVLTLERNRQWWTTGPLLSYGQRVGFPGSLLVWEYYPGQGIEIQWLASFGRANGYFLSGRAENQRLGRLLDELVGLAVQRAGGIAWEYDFEFGGGYPPWVSAIAEGTAVQALSRGAIRLARPAYFEAARQALTIFEVPPPVGVRLRTPNGAWYLIYSFAPHQLVLNAFIQSLIGLYDFATLANDQTGRTLFADGDVQARIDVPRYDTGAWSLYDQSTESDLGYHKLLGGFLRNLCDRTQHPAPSIAGSIAAFGTRGARAIGSAPVTGGSPAPAGGKPTAPRLPGPPPVPGSPSPAPVPGSPSPAPAPGSPGPAPAAGSPAPSPARAPTPAPAPEPATNIFCATSTAFTADLHQPPKVSLGIVGRPQAGRPAGLRLTLSKISDVAMTAARAGHVSAGLREQLRRGSSSLPWTPPGAGRYLITVSATDLAGNTARTSLVVSVAPRRRPHANHA